MNFGKPYEGTLKKDWCLSERDSRVGNTWKTWETHWEWKSLSDYKMVNERNLGDVLGEYWELNLLVTCVTLLIKGRGWIKR